MITRDDIVKSLGDYVADFYGKRYGEQVYIWSKGNCVTAEPVEGDGVGLRIVLDGGKLVIGRDHCGGEELDLADPASFDQLVEFLAAWTPTEAYASEEYDSSWRRYLGYHCNQ